VGRGCTRVRISPQWSSEEEDVGLRPVHFIVRPASALLHSQASPLILRQQASFRHLLEDALRQVHVSVLVVLIRVLLRVLNFSREVRHLNIMEL